VKKPGSEQASIPVELSLMEQPSDDAEAYEQLLTNALKGDPSLFVRDDVVEAAWLVVNNILNDQRPVLEYEPGTWGPSEADRLAADLGGWHNPS
jgi:glucose-6-phosphate 1-dehydrogenase